MNNFITIIDKSKIKTFLESSGLENFKKISFVWGCKVEKKIQYLKKGILSTFGNRLKR